MSGPHRVAVIGAGIVGLCVAAALQADGHGVTLIDPAEPGGRHAASFGNGAWLSPASVVPMSMPGMWRKVPGYLADPLGPLAIRWQALPTLLPWLLRFLRAGATVAKVERTAAALRPLLADSPERHAALAGWAGAPGLIRRDGLLYAYPSRAAFAADALAWRLRRDNGVAWRELDETAMRATVPALRPHYGFGALVEAGGHCTDPGAYLLALFRRLQADGAEWHRAAATGFDVAGGRLRAVKTAAGDVPCDRAVIAAGIGARGLARAAGDRVSLESERGYHVAIAGAGELLPLPVMPSDGRMANTPTAAGLRASGQVELATRRAPPDWRRADVLLRQVLASYDGPFAPLDPARVSTWMGHRPSTPDGLPVIGPAADTADIVHAFGHGHVGLAAAPATAALVAALVAGRAPPFDPGPYRAARFGRRSRHADAAARHADAAGV